MIRKFFNVDQNEGAGGLSQKARDFIKEGIEQEGFEKKLPDPMEDPRFSKEIHNLIKEMRKGVNSLELTMQELINNGPKCFKWNYSKKSIGHLQKARHFLGKILAERNAEYPYPANASNAALADAGELKYYKKGDNQFDILKELREGIETQIIHLQAFVQTNDPVSWLETSMTMGAAQQLVLAKTMLGELMHAINKIATKNREEIKEGQ